YKERPLICDFFTRFKLEVIAEMKSGMIEVTKLIEYDLLLQGAPHIFIKGQFLRFFDESVSWHAINSPSELSPDAYARYKEELEDTTLVEFGFEKAAKPLPTLELTDDTLAFANSPHYEPPGYSKKVVGSSSYYCPVDKAVETVSKLLDEGWKVL